MKKSILLAMVAIVVYIAILAATNLKLKAEYNKGNYANTTIKTSLPSFSYIKEDLNPRMSNDYRCAVLVMQADANSLSVDSVAIKLIDFSVKNDTLFLTQSEEAIRKGYFFFRPLTIFASQLKGVIASRNELIVRQLNVDSLQVVAYGRSQVNLQQISVDNLAIYGEKTASIRIETTDSIENGRITLKGRSSFEANNVIIKNRNLDLSDSSSLRLSGKSVPSFGIQ